MQARGPFGRAEKKPGGISDGTVFLKVKTVVLTGGGTAGHITPNLALLSGLREAGCRLYYIGLKGGMEEKLVHDAGVEFFGIRGGKLRRYADLRNVTDLGRIAAGFFEAELLLGKLKPDLLFSKGGFVSSPVVWAAATRHVPVVIHESDMTVGLANRLAVRFATKICYTFPETASQLPQGKAVHTGLPIRRELLEGSREKGLAACGFRTDKPVLVVMGGSQGSEFINHLVRRALPDLLPMFQVCHICGKTNADPLMEGREGYRQFEYVTDLMPHLYAAADLFVTRGGATSLFEILAVKKPCLIIPYSTKASRGDQIVNAASFEKHGYGLVLAEQSSRNEGPDGMLTVGQLVRTVEQLYNGRSGFSAAMAKSPAQNGLRNVLRVILETAGVETPASKG